MAKTFLMMLAFGEGAPRVRCGSTDMLQHRVPMLKLPKHLRPKLVSLRYLVPAFGFALSLGMFGGCASRPIDLVKQSCPRTAVSLTTPPIGAAVIRLRADRRPLNEQGKSSFLGTSTVPDQDFDVPLLESILRVIARDSRDAKLFTMTTLIERDQPLRVDVVVEHARIGFTEGVSTLIPVLPTSSLESQLVLRLIFMDIDGRVYLDRVYSDSQDAMGAAIANRKSSAADLFGLSLRHTIDAFMLDARVAYDVWWARYPETRPIWSTATHSR